MNSQPNYNNPETLFFSEEISKCEHIDELRERIFPLLKSQQEEWGKKVSEILSESGCSKTAFAKKCKTSRVTVDSWCKGSIPRNRETFLRIGMSANYDLDRMNQLLQRYGKYPALYSKSLEDCVCMFVLHNYGNEAIEKYDYILNKIKNRLTGEAAIGTKMEPDNVNTVIFNEKVAELKDEDELEHFISENTAIFSSAYHRFYTYVKMAMNANYQLYANSIFDMAEGQGWSSSLKQCVSAIRQNKWYPTRNKIISLGLHLSMDRDEIDRMLELAHMEPLCAKNIFESVIIFILEDADINDMLNREMEEYDPDALCRYAKEILEDADIPEVAFFISELSEINDTV